MTALTAAAPSPWGKPGAARLVLLLAVVALVATAPAAFAGVYDPVPLPHLRPHGSGAPAARPTSAARPSGPLTQAQLLARISSYFNSFKTMQGEFVQFGPHGGQSQGVFFLSRPGKIRFHYRPPTRLDVIADGRSVAVRDLKAMTQDLYPLKKTPLRYLLASHIDLASSPLVRQVRQEKDLISLVIVDDSAFAEGKLTLIFDRESYELRQWVVTDAQGLDTTVAIYNVTVNKPQDPGLFRITVMTRPSGG